MNGGRVLLIDGRSGSGKTSLAEALVARTGGRLVHVEDYYPGWGGLAEGAAAVVDDVLIPWRNGETVPLRSWNWHTDRFEPAGELPAGGDLIIEGCGAVTRRSVEHADLAVWLEVDEPLRHARALARDGDDAWWAGWRAQEDALALAEQSAQRADLVVGPDAGVDEVLALIEERLPGFGG